VPIQSTGQNRFDMLKFAERGQKAVRNVIKK